MHNILTEKRKRTYYTLGSTAITYLCSWTYLKYSHDLLLGYQCYQWDECKRDLN